YGNFKSLRLQYQKVLNQRNGLIKSMTNEKNLKVNLTLEVWDESLVKYGTDIMERRLMLLDEISRKFADYMNYFFHDIKAEIFYQFSWNRKTAAGEEYKKTLNASNNYFSESDRQNPDNNTGKNETGKNIKEMFNLKLKENLKRDINFKTTIIGPHRDDLVILINGKDLRAFGSQGQQRIASICLKFSELSLLEEKLKKIPVLLLDDVLSELDLKRKKLLVDLINDKSQTFITTSNIDYLNDVDDRLIDKFRVKDNTIEMINE
ncbi:MAG: hypothetical protein M1409_03045, partial [Actinobacteria bacterium]|nr:hypothetical protein [Actinomycetota bacterium]